MLIIIYFMVVNRVNLINVPQYMPDMPTIALPLLKGCLKQEGIESKVIDSNIEFYHRLISSVGSSGVDSASRDLRRPLEFHELGRYVEARVLLESVLQESSSRFSGNLGFMSSSLMHSPTDSGGVIEALDNKKGNPYLDFFEENVGKYVAPVVGIGIGIPEQVIPAFTLARIMRGRFPDVKIVLGGNTYTRIAEGIKGNERLMRLFDYGVESEADIVFPELVKLLLDGKNVNSNQLEDLSQRVPDLNKVPVPDFSFFDLKMYFSPEPVLSVRGGRGCYYGTCSFGAIHRAYKDGGRFRGKSPEQVLNEVKSYQEGLGVSHFKFNEESHHPDFAIEFAKLVEQNGLNFAFEAFANLEPWIIREGVAEQLFRGGYRRFMYGLETISEDVIKAVHKGNAHRNNKQNLIYKNVHDNGILPFVFLMTGIPGQSEDSNWATADYLINNRDIGNFALSVYSLDHLAPDANGGLGLRGVEDIKRAGDLATYYIYTIDGKNPGNDNRELAKKVLSHIYNKRADLAFMSCFLPAARLVYINRYGNDFAQRFVNEHGLPEGALELANNTYTKARIERKK